jgi:predicted GNAT family acetyltransferase
MDVRCFDHAGVFARQAAAYLDVDPFSSSVIAVQVEAVRAGFRPEGAEDRYWTLVEDKRVVGIAMHTPPHNLFIARMPDDAAAQLAASVARAGRTLVGVTGELQAAGAFAAAWKECTGQTSDRAVSMRMYRLAELVVPAAVPGQARLASQHEVELVATWLSAFHEEAEPHRPVGDSSAVAGQRVTAGQVSVWEVNAEAVSMACFSHPVAGVSRVGPVYTPPSRRGQGYGAAVTAQATAAAIAGGAKDVVLYTDLSNPTSNAIYQAIGYRAEHDAEERAFNL